MNFVRNLSFSPNSQPPSKPVNSIAPFPELQQLYDRIVSYISSKNNDEVGQFTTILEETIKADPIKRVRLSEAEIDCFTLIQHCSRHEGLEEFLTVLLSANINPNPTKGHHDGHPMNNEKHCAILAAEIGNHKVIEALIQYNRPTLNDGQEYEADTSAQKLQSPESMVRARGLKSNLAADSSATCDFNKYTTSNETVLHVLLQRPLLQDKIAIECIKGTSTVNRQKKKELKKESVKINKKYQKCIDLLLDEHTLNGNLEYKEQIRSLINIKDSPHGNTPLHYAVHNWPEKVVKQILQAGGNPAVKNRDGKKPLSMMKLKTLRKFLDNCMSPVLDENRNIASLSLEGEKKMEVNKLKAGYRIKKLLNNESKPPIDDVPVNFKIGFLAPAITEHISNKGVAQISSGSREMDAIQSISDSKVHNELVTHPVLKAYNWTKWKLLAKAYNRTLRLYVLFAMCLTWFIFDQFGGRKWKHIGAFGSFFKGKYKNTTDDFNHHQCFDSAKFNDSVYSFGTLSLSRNETHYGKRADEMYMWFSAHAVVQLFFILCDLFDSKMIRSLKSEELKSSKRSKFAVILSILQHAFKDILTTTLILIVLVGSREILWFVLAILLAYESFRELLQMLASVKKYFSQLDNYLDLLFLAVVTLLVLVPDKNYLLKDSCRFTLETDVDASCDAMHEVVSKNCLIKRCFAAFTIVIMWLRVFNYIALHPKLDKLNLYMSMFRQVRDTFLEFLVYYAIYIISFGMGFYILLHKDTEIDWASGKEPTSALTNLEPSCPAAKDPCDCQGPHYHTPWYSFAKTFIMFLGELDYDDFLDRVEGGNITKAMSMFFFLFFVFMLNMVLLNLLNAMAISDTANVVEKSKIYGEMSTIQTIGYMEFVIYNNLWSMHRIVSLFGCAFPMETLLERSGTMLFQSEYLNESKSDLTIGMKNQKTNNLSLMAKKFRTWYGGGECEQILFEARKILQKRRKHKSICKSKDSKAQSSSSSSSDDSD